MARLSITREIVSSTIHIAEVVSVNGTPTTQRLNPIKVTGSMSLEQAQRFVDKRFKESGKRVTVFEIKTDAKKYRMSVEDFIKHGELVEDKQDEKEQA